MADGRILPYLDIPFQHASARILRAMRRPANAENMLKRIRKWRETCPELTLRSTFIVGFPGETEADFRELLEFLEEAQLDRVGCFSYSPVEGASANELAHPVAEETKRERLERFMDVQARISAAKLQRKVGHTLSVLVDEVGGGRAVARSAADAPEIDGLVYVGESPDLRVGDFAEVTVIGADEHDLHARLSGQSALSTDGDSTTPGCDDAMARGKEWRAGL
jgi:ribosomal protein S12 methylthiotransferase